MKKLACALLAAALIVTLNPVNAHAEVEHPRQAWLRASTAGLFLHWGMFTAPRHLDCAAWERDVTGGGWTADYWIDEARKLGASYIVLATFHSRLGYARPWPSRIPGSCAMQRDLLGELVAAGRAKDVRIILYMTDDPQWHSEQGIQTLDSAAYSTYKGQQVDLTTRPGFGMFSYDLFFEVMDEYPDLAGFWIDNDNEYWEQNRLYEQIRQRRPSWLLSNNNEDTPIMDTVSNEQKTGMTPAYDYPQAAFTPLPRLTEADYKLPTTGDWWYDGRDHPVDFRLSTGRYITNAGSSMKSLMAETPMVNGRFPPQQEAFNNFMAQWVPPIRESLQGTEGGGYMFGGMQPGFWNDGAHGVITVNPGTRTQYVHVVTRPRTDYVRLRDNGYRIARVTDVRTGKPMRFAQFGGTSVHSGHHRLGRLRHGVQSGDSRAARISRRDRGLRVRFARGLPGVEPHRRQLHQPLGQRRDPARLRHARPWPPAPGRLSGRQSARDVAYVCPRVVRPARGFGAHQGLSGVRER